MMATDPIEPVVHVFSQKMRETYLMLGKLLIPSMSSTSEDPQTLRSWAKC